MTPRPGSLVVYWDRDEALLGLVVGEERQRVRLLRPRGRDERVRPERIAVAITDGGTPPGADPAGLERARAEVAALAERLGREAAAVDVAVLWEIVRESEEAGPVRLRSLADLALGSRAGEARAITLLALVADGLHFVRRADGWLPRESDAVAMLCDERERLARREGETAEFLGGLAAAVAAGQAPRRGTEAERRYLEALERVAVERDAAPEAARALALEALGVSGLGWVRPHDGAFRLLRRLGRFASDDENIEILRYALHTSFPDDAVERAATRSAAGFSRGGRRDLTGLPASSIDGPHTREIDDLLTLEPRPGGGGRVGVHIADPAAFVEPGDPVDREALARGVTHYMPDVRLPMLPPVLSEQAASLVAGADRPALSFLVDVDADGAVERYEIVPSIVRSARCLSYAEADARIAAGDETLGELAAIGRLRRAARARDGAMILDAPEVDLHVDADGRIELERLAADSSARLLVTEAMLLVGALAARFCVEHALDVVYRRQASSGEPPPPAGEPGALDPPTVRRLRRSMRRAETGLRPGPHAGLGLEAYVQASSPLRRFQDLVVHRQILARLRGEPAVYDVEALRRVAATTERAEADARRAEAAADEYWTLRYLERSIGREVAATVVEIDPRPVVQLDETLYEQSVAGLSGVQPGDALRLRVVRVEPRAGLLTLTPVA